MEIAEKVEEDKAAHYANYQVAFADLNETAVKEDWRGKLSVDGKITTSVTYIGYLLAGQPEKVQLWSPGKNMEKDEPETEVKFTLKAPKTVVPLGGQTPDWLNGAWSKAEYGNGAQITGYSRESVRFTILNDHTLLHEEYYFQGDPSHGWPWGVDYAYEREYTYDPATETVIISETYTGVIQGKVYDWTGTDLEKDHLREVMIIRKPEKDNGDDICARVITGYLDYSEEKLPTAGNLRFRRPDFE